MGETLFQVVPALQEHLRVSPPPVDFPGATAFETALASVQVNQILMAVQSAPNGRKSLHSAAAAMVEAFHRRSVGATDIPSSFRWKYLKFVSTVIPAGLAAHQRRFNDAYDWITLGLCDDISKLPVGGLSQGTLHIGLFTSFFEHGVVPSPLLLDDLAAWSSTLLFTSRASGAFREIVLDLLQMFKVALQDAPTLGGRVELAIELGEWLADHDVETVLLPDLARIVLSGIPRLSPGGDDMCTAALALQGRLGQSLKVDRELFAPLLRRHPDPLLRIQVYAEDLRLGNKAIVPQFMESITAFKTYFNITNVDLDVLAGQTFRVIAPALLVLGREGQHRLLLEILATWRHFRKVEDVDYALNIWIPNAITGALLVHAKGSEQYERINHVHLIDCLNAFRKSAIVRRGSLVPVKLGDEARNRDRDEAVNDASGMSYLDAVQEMLAGGVAESLENSSAFCVIPFEPHPVQAALAGRGLSPRPWSTSLRVPLADRKIRKVALIATDHTAGDMEFPWLKQLFLTRNVEIIAPVEVSVKSIREIYEDPSFDVIWFAGHGEFFGRQMAETHIPIDSGIALTLDDMYSWSIPQNLRRLLVLNLCYGGMAPLVEGLGELGFGTRLAGPSQAVVSHLWNVDWLVAPIFGAILADSLLMSGNFHEGFVHALTHLLKGKEDVLWTLADCDLWDAAERCDRLTADLASLAHWGSPVFFQ